MSTACVTDAYIVQASGHTIGACRIIGGTANAMPEILHSGKRNMRPYIAISALLGVLVLCHVAQGSDDRGFKGIHIGQPEASLPKSLEKSLPLTYEGVHDGDYFRVMVMEAKVFNFQVIYAGEKSDRSAISKKLTLAQALKDHSLGRANVPKLALARGRDGQVWGLIDLANAIGYSTHDPTAPDSTIANVGYLRPTAPVLNARRDDILSESAAQVLLKEAAAMKADSKDVEIIPPNVRYSQPTREKALAALTEQADIVIGRGKRTLALISQAEIWLGIDENHPDAKQTFVQLRQFSRAFTNDYVTLTKIYEANKGMLGDSDLTVLVEPLELNERITRKMTQLRAMGFREIGTPEEEAALAVPNDRTHSVPPAHR